jgi:large subunit ribosomal protein L20
MRVKKGVTARRRHKKILNLAKGFRMTRHKQFKKAMEGILHAGEYAFHGRKRKKRLFRTIWTVRINAFARNNNLNYSTFIHKLKTNKIELDRKILSHLANHHPHVLQSILKQCN